MLIAVRMFLGTAVLATAASILVFGGAGTDISARDDEAPASGGALSSRQVVLLDPMDDPRWFGSSIAVAFDTIVVGTTSEYSAYVFSRSNGLWLQQEILQPWDLWDRPGLGRFFGSSTAMDSDTMLIGAPRDAHHPITDVYNGEEGAVYTYSRTGDIWTPQQKLILADAEVRDHFGQTVALSGMTAAVSTPDRFFGDGRVHLFDHVGGEWSHAQVLRPSGTRWADAKFGKAIALDGDSLAVARSGDCNYNDEPGAVHVFDRVDGTWVEQLVLRPENPSRCDGFGSALALEGDTLVIGEPGAQRDFVYMGAAHVFHREDGAWTQVATLLPDGQPFSFFGMSVEVHGNTILVGAPLDVGSGEDTGVVYIFSRGDGDQWVKQETIAPPLPLTGGEFGRRLAFDGRTAVVGAPGANAVFACELVQTLESDIDIKPDSYPNNVNPYSRGVIPVAILGSDTFDVANVDVTTLAFGPDGAPIAHLNGHLQDVNYDGIVDLMTHFRTQDTGIVCGDESAILTGATRDGQAIEGTDSINTVGCRGRGRPAIGMRDQNRLEKPRGDGPVNIERK